MNYPKTVYIKYANRHDRNLLASLDKEAFASVVPNKKIELGVYQLVKKIEIETQVIEFDLE